MLGARVDSKFGMKSSLVSVLAAGAVGFGLVVLGWTYATMSPAASGFTTPTANTGSTITAKSCFAPVDVDVGNFYYNPDPLTIDVGCTVRWTVSSNSPHTTTSETALWDSGLLSKNESFEYTFNSTGTFRYLCTIHPASMTGAQVIVQ